MAEKPQISWLDVFREHQRVTLERRWHELNVYHRVFGCPLEIDESNKSWGPCIIHGMFKGDRELTKEEYMGSFSEPPVTLPVTGVGTQE